jgi:light-independent protochlorophyllide reductase subunit B
VLFDTWVHPLMMGLEEHLLGMFREDFEFHDGAAPSHLGHGNQRGQTPLISAPAGPVAEALETGANDPNSAPAPVTTVLTDQSEASDAPAAPSATPGAPVWHVDAELELRKIPFFVRGKARRNTERFAQDRGLALITVETLYDAKAHFGR